MTKRLISLVLTLAMVLTLFAGLTLTTHAADGTYTQVTDASTLAAGDTILLAKADSSAYAGAMGSSAFFTSVASQADAIEITLSGDSTGWTFTTSEGTIGTSAAKKLNHTGSGTTTWTISIDGDGLATIASTNSSYGKFLYNNTSPRFLNYTSNVSSSMQLPIIYKKDGGSSTGHTHSWGDWYTNNDGTHSRDCDDPDGDCPDPTETANCTYGATTVVTPATCSSVGSGTHTCTVCGYTETVEIPVDANAHNWEWDGNEGANGTHGLECANCGATSTEACVDTDDDDVCDICGADIPALTTATGDIVFSTLGLTNAQQYTSFNSDNGYFTVSFGDGGNDGKYYNTGTGIRVYSGGHMTVAATTGTITKVEIQCSGTGYMPTSNSTIDSGSISFDGTKATWTGDAASVTFTRESASNHWRIQSVSVTVSLASGSHVHSWGDWYTNNDGTHSRDCDDPDGDCPDPTETASCTYGDITVVTPATCSSVGSGTHTCTVCGYTETVEIPIDANAHVWEWDGNEGANGTHGTVCNECGATGTEACVDTDDDDVCDVCGADIPVPKTYTLNTELHDGDEVVIVYTASNMALTATASGAKLAGVAVTPSNGELTVELGSTVAVLTVEMISGDANNSFYLKSSDGKYLTSAATGNGVSFADDASDCGKWYLRNVNTTNNTVGLMNAGANYNGNYNQGLEYYSGFTTYGWKDNNSAYVFSLYTIVNQAAHVHDWDQGSVTTAATCTATGVMTYTCNDCGDERTEDIPMIAHADGDGDGLCDSCGGTIYNLATVLNEGDSVVIYHPVSKTALTKTASGTRLVAEAANGQSGVIAVGASSDIAVLTVEYLSGSDTDFYLIDADGNYLTTGETGNSLTLEATATDYSIWTLTAVDTSNCLIINKNAAYNSYQIAVEYYTTFNGYSWKDNGDTAFYMELYTNAAPAAPIAFSASLTTEASDQGALKLNFYVQNAPTLSYAKVNGGEAITGTNTNDGVKFVVPVAMKEFKQLFTLVAYDANDVELGSTTYSVQDYLDANAHDPSSTDPETDLEKLVDALDNLGRLAEAQFNNNSDATELVNAKAATETAYAALSADMDAYIASFNNYTATPATNAAAVSFYGASLILEDQVTLRVYFKLDTDKDATLKGNDFTIKLNGNTIDAKLTQYETTKYWYYDISEIAAKDLGEGKTVEITNGTYTAKLENYSPLTYAAKVITKGTADETLIALCKALFVYQAKAAAYFG